MEGAAASARLLVVDDETTILELLSGSLRLAGFEVVTAASGTEAVRAVASGRPDLILLDVMMPDGDGFEVLRRIRSGGAEDPVIFLTARDEVPDRVTGFAVGADDYVPKPFSLDELLGRIRAVLKRTRPDLILLDVMMPDGDGFEALRRIRSGGAEVPVIFLTARDEVPDRVTGFAVGADDYVPKPFSLDELLGRIRAVLKRTRPDAPGSRLCVADLELDEDAHEVRRAGALVSLTPTEYRLLRFLLVNAGRVVSKGQILDHVWEYDPGRDGAVVEPCLSYLRRKVDQGEPRLIHTVRGFGYVLRIPPP